MRTIAIIGGGFSGTVTAVQLLRQYRQPLHVRVINNGYPLGRGIAYSTRRGEHLLNVAARNMSALPDQPNHFVDWLGTRTDFADIPESSLREQFLPRRVYGDYLQSLLWWSTRGAANGHAEVDLVQGEVVGLLHEDGKAAIEIDDGRSFVADKVLLATGNQPPAALSCFAGVANHPAFCANPWQGWEIRLPDPGDNILLVGTGLTMIDTFLTLARLDWKGTIYALSRNGLLPLSHFKGIEYPDFPPEDPTRHSLVELVGLMETHCARLRQQGANPAIVVDKLRPFTQRIWQHLSVAEKQHFLRAHKTRWNVTRHRIAQSIHAELVEAQAAGRLRILAADQIALEPDGQRICATVSAEHGQQPIACGLVINCTGPHECYAACPAPLWQGLFCRGLVQADDLNLGIAVDSDFAVMDRAGMRQDWLFAMGPLLRGTLWETTAVPELRIQAQRVAEAMLAAFERRRAPAAGFAEMYADVLEYCI